MFNAITRTSNTIAIPHAPLKSPDSLISQYNFVVRVAPAASFPVKLPGIWATVPAVSNNAADSPTIRPILNRIATKIPGRAPGSTTL